MELYYVFMSAKDIEVASFLKKICLENGIAYHICTDTEFKKVIKYREDMVILIIEIPSKTLLLSAKEMLKDFCHKTSYAYQVLLTSQNNELFESIIEHKLLVLTCVDPSSQDWREEFEEVIKLAKETNKKVISRHLKKEEEKT